MKKSLILGIIGVAAAASSYGQGYVSMSSYLSAAGGPTTLPGGALVGPSYSAELWYSLTPVSDPVDTTAGSITALPAVGLTELSSSITPYLANGFFDALNAAVIPGYTGGNVYFEVLSFTGASYANASSRGRTGSFMETGLPTSTSLPPATFANFPAISQVATVSVVPEPTTLALAGLGGLASLVALRRKQA